MFLCHGVEGGQGWGLEEGVAGKFGEERVDGGCVEEGCEGGKGGGGGGVEGCVEGVEEGEEFVGVYVGESLGGLVVGDG